MRHSEAQLDRPRSQDPARRLASEANRLALAGDYQAAIASATESLRLKDDSALQEATVRWRLEAAAVALDPAGPAVWPPSLPDPFPGETGIPTIAAAELTADILGGAIQHHGSIRVNGLVSPETAARLRAGIDRALAARDSFQAGAPDADPGWYAQLRNPHVDASRQWVETGGAVWTAESPAMLAELIETFTQSGVISHITELMGERPTLSVGKSTLRRVPATTLTDWHQDGAFLGRDVRAVNVWLALSDCGVDAPGLDVVGTRLPYVVQTGTHGAHFNWSVGPALVDCFAEGGTPVLAPAFAPGDALLFDHLMLHRTGVRPGMTRSRWAIESWFFARTGYPMQQVPLAV
jgi:hypothetical protein